MPIYLSATRQARANMASISCCMEIGWDCKMAAPSLIRKKAGDRLKIGWCIRLSLARGKLAPDDTHNQQLGQHCAGLSNSH